MNKEDDFIKDWEEIRTKGKIRYILHSNISFFKSNIVFIIIIFILAIIVSIFIKTEIINSQIIIKTLMRILTFFSMLIIYSYIRWLMNEKRYEKLKQKNKKL